jgi:hypothetical protein
VRYGEALGLGSRHYELVDVFPVAQTVTPHASYIRAH